MKTGDFKECTYGQLLDEQELLLTNLDLEDTYYFGSHPSNVVPMQGRLPDNKTEMIDVIRDHRKRLRRRLEEYPARGGEGSILKR